MQSIPGGGRPRDRAGFHEPRGRSSRQKPFGGRVKPNPAFMKKRLMPNPQFLIDVKLKKEKIESFAEYPFHLNVVKNLKTIAFHPSVTFLVGENGSGKSTLLEALAVALGINPEGGGKNFRFETRSSHSGLHAYLRVAKGVRRPKDAFFLRAESFYNVATEIEKMDREPGGGKIIDSYGGVSLHALSHGESFMALLTNRFRGDSLYLLDEPEAALSPSRQLALIARLHQLVMEGSQFVIATHSPIVMAYPNSTLYMLLDDAIQQTPYEETEHYRITKNFVNGYQRMLDMIMEE